MGTPLVAVFIFLYADSKWEALRRADVWAAPAADLVPNIARPEVCLGLEGR